MAGDKVNNYSQVDSNILELQLTTDKTFKGYHQLTLTNYDNTTVPAIAAGSAIECNGALYKFDSEEAISTTDPVTSATVADGTVYVCIIPGATTCTAAFTATAPTWSDSKQGWYGTGGQANYRYAEFVIIKSTTLYYKDSFNNSNITNNKSYVSCFINGIQDISNAHTSPVKIKYTSKIYDNLSEFDESINYRFTAKKAGFYYISASGHLSDNPNNVSIYLDIYKNGSIYAAAGGHHGYSNTNIWNSIYAFMLIYLLPSEFIEIYSASLADSSYKLSYYSLNIYRV